MVELIITNDLRYEYPNLFIPHAIIQDVQVEVTQTPKFKEELEEVSHNIREKYTLENLKDNILVRRYRDFFWRLNIDPTKIRPASEALIRRVLAEKPFPMINNLVDVYNLVSLETGIPLAAFDLAHVSGNALIVRFAQANERFIGISMKKENIMIIPLLKYSSMFLKKY